MLDQIDPNQYDALHLRGCSPIAQLVEQMTVNHWVAGSSPARGAIQGIELKGILKYFFKYVFKY